MNLKRIILVLIASCVGFLSHDYLFGYEDFLHFNHFNHCHQDGNFLQDDFSQTESETQDLSALYSTIITPASDCCTLAVPRTINAPVHRTANTRRTAGQNHLESRSAHMAKEISRRFFSKSIVEPSYRQNISPKSSDYIVSIGILVI